MKQLDSLCINLPFFSLKTSNLQQIVEYDKCLEQLVSISGEQSNEYRDLCKWNSKSKVMIKESDCFTARRKMSKSEEMKVKKGRKSIHWPFKRSPRCENSLDDNRTFDVVNLCTVDGLGQPLRNLLEELYDKGPSLIGIFRKSANARITRELKSKLEANPECDISDYPVTAIASLFKELLRSLPDGLLQADLYNDWMDAIDDENALCRRTKVSKCIEKLKPGYVNLLRYFLCVLWRISQNSNENKMCSMNLAVCISPSMLPNHSQFSPKRCEEVSKQVPKLIAYLIDHCVELFGPGVISLLGKSGKLDSGGEEESVKSEDLSIESLERILIQDGCPSQSPLENKMSLSNLSRDSGLTSSDTQLYSPEDSDNSSPFTSRAYITKSVPRLDSRLETNDPNLTFSYGRSVGVSIGGSCYDVVRKRRHEPKKSPDGLETFQYERENEIKVEATPRYPRNNARYRLRRPPLSAVLSDGSNRYNGLYTLRKSNSTSEESISMNYEGDKVGLNYMGVNRLYPKAEDDCKIPQYICGYPKLCRPKTASTSSSCSLETWSSRSTPNSTPPSYQETMNRKLLAPKTTTALFERSVRLYHQDLKNGSNVIVRAIPVRVNTDSDSDTELFGPCKRRQNNTHTELGKCPYRAHCT